MLSRTATRSGDEAVTRGVEAVERARATAREVVDRLDRTRGTQPLAIVLGSDVNGLSFVRSLGRRGIATVVVDSWASHAASSRFATFALLPDVESHPDSWIAFLERVAELTPGRAALLPTSDASTSLVADTASSLGRSYDFLVPDRQVVQRIVDKRAQYEFAQRNGVLVPRVHFPESATEAERCGRAVSYPCILKPQVSHAARAQLAGSPFAGRKAWVTNDRRELVDTYERVASHGVRLMVQEIVPGPDRVLVGYLGLWDADGEERASLTKRKLRQNPPGAGDGSLQETFDAPPVVDASRRLLRALGYSGLVGVEFKYDARDRSFRLIEVNPRSVSCNQLAISAGVDFPWLAYESLSRTGDPGRGLGAARQPSPTTRHVRFVNEEWDIRAFRLLRREGRLTVRAWLRSLRGIESTAIWARDDRRPFLAWLETEARRAGADLRTRRPKAR